MKLVSFLRHLYSRKFRIFAWRNCLLWRKGIIFFQEINQFWSRNGRTDCTIWISTSTKSIAVSSRVIFALPDPLMGIQGRRRVPLQCKKHITVEGEYGCGIMADLNTGKGLKACVQCNAGGFQRDLWTPIYGSCSLRYRQKFAWRQWITLNLLFET